MAESEARAPWGGDSNLEEALREVEAARAALQELQARAYWPEPDAELVARLERAEIAYLARARVFDRAFQAWQRSRAVHAETRH